MGSRSDSSLRVKCFCFLMLFKAFYSQTGEGNRGISLTIPCPCGLRYSRIMSLTRTCARPTTQKCMRAYIACADKVRMFPTSLLCLFLCLSPLPFSPSLFPGDVSTADRLFLPSFCFYLRCFFSLKNTPQCQTSQIRSIQQLAPAVH